jgi:hypothetical protein
VAVIVTIILFILIIGVLVFYGNVIVLGIVYGIGYGIYYLLYGICWLLWWALSGICSLCFGPPAAVAIALVTRQLLASPRLEQPGLVQTTRPHLTDGVESGP